MSTEQVLCELGKFMVALGFERVIVVAVGYSIVTFVLAQIAKLGRRNEYIPARSEQRDEWQEFIDEISIESQKGEYNE